MATALRTPRRPKRLKIRARPWRFVIARAPARRTTAPGSGDAAPLRTACTRTVTVARRPARTVRGDTVTRRWAGAGAAQLDAVVPVGRTATDTALAPVHAVTRSTSAPGADVMLPPRTSVA